MSRKVVQLKVGDFDVALAFYADNIFIVIHNSVPGFGSIFFTERGDASIDVDQLLGVPNEMLLMLARKIAERFSITNLTIVMAFPPRMLESFDAVKSFLDGLSAAVSPPPRQ
jgi:hypothetical protein